jgi:protoheme IX farnesyltransferase
MPTLVGLSGGIYFVAALVLGLGFLACAVLLAVRQGASDARRLLVASLLYLPTLLLFMAFDRLPL